MAFLERLQTYPNLPGQLVSHLGSLYHLSTSSNAEIRFRFYEIALAESSSPTAKQFAEEAAKWVVGSDGTGVVKGRMKFCRPTFRAIANVNKTLAVETFTPNKGAFHPIAVKLIEKVSPFLGTYGFVADDIRQKFSRTSVSLDTNCNQYNNKEGQRLM